MMKPYIIALGALALLICSTFSITVAASEPKIHLPTQYVTMKAMVSTENYFKITLSDIPVGYDVTNGSYPGWCVQTSASMTRGVNHTVVLYSSYDPAMPTEFKSPNWDKVNYLINNLKEGNSRESIQNAIWYFICNYSYPSNDTQAREIVVAANVADNDSSFIPQAGDTIAILVNVTHPNVSVQRTFFEMQLPPLVTLGDFVWNDLNADGIQDAGEPGIPGVVVALYFENGTLFDSTTTYENGVYSFAYFPLGRYYIEFTLPSGYLFSPKDQGINDLKDSDVIQSTGRTDVAFFNASLNDSSWDAGMYIPASPENPGTPVTRKVPNHAPTADGTAGEPLKGFIDEVLYFNGSRSYDRDGTIVSWHWSFGDGTTANGSVVAHAYGNAGTYTVLLTVTDDDGATDTYHTFAHIKVPNRAPLKPALSGLFEGNRNVSYAFTIVTTDPDNDNVKYTILWGDGSQNVSPSFKSNQSIETLHQWSSLGFYTVRVSAQDPSNATSEVCEAVVSIDVRYVGSLGYLMNTDGMGSFDMFYSNQTGNITVVHQLQSGEYLLDTNGDGTADFQYNPSSGLLQAYPVKLGSEYMMLFAGMVVVIVFIVLLAFFVKWRKGRSQ